MSKAQQNKEGLVHLERLNHKVQSRGQTDTLVQEDRREQGRRRQKDDKGKAEPVQQKKQAGSMPAFQRDL
jgi:hypothetical protein